MNAKDLNVDQVVGLGSGDHGRLFRLLEKISLCGKPVGTFESLDGRMKLQRELIGEVAFGEHYASDAEFWWPEGVGRDGLPLMPQRHEGK